MIDLGHRSNCRTGKARGADLVLDAKYFRRQAIVALRKAAAESDPAVRAAYCEMVDDYLRKARQAQLIDSLAPQSSDGQPAAGQKTRRS